MHRLEPTPQTWSPTETLNHQKFLPDFSRAGSRRALSRIPAQSRGGGRHRNAGRERGRRPARSSSRRRLGAVPRLTLAGAAKVGAGPADAVVVAAVPPPPTAEEAAVLFSALAVDGVLVSPVAGARVARARLAVLSVILCVSLSCGFEGPAGCVSVPGGLA